MSRVCPVGRKRQLLSIPARLLKQLFPRIKIFVGGRYPSAIKEKGLEEAPELDGVVYGEGEYTFSEIASRISRSETMKGVCGSIVRENGEIIINSPRPVIKDLDILPFPDRDMVCERDYIPPSGTYKELPHTYIYCSRGCPYGCIYCDTERDSRVRSPGNIVDEIEYCVKKYSVRDFTLLDNSLSVYRDRIIEICEEILRRGLDIVWSTEMRVDAVSPEQLRIMKKAGCWKILYGIESAVQRNLDFLNKNIDAGRIKEAVNIAKSEGIEVLGSFIIGIPGETYEDALKTIRLACDLDLDYASFSNLTPFPRTILSEKASEWGEIVSDGPFDLANVTFVPFSMTYKELKSLIRISTRSFYLRLGYILKRAKKIRTIGEFLRLTRGLVRVIMRIISTSYKS